MLRFAGLFGAIRTLGTFFPLLPIGGWFYQLRDDRYRHNGRRQGAPVSALAWAEILDRDETAIAAWAAWEFAYVQVPGFLGRMPALCLPALCAGAFRFPEGNFRCRRRCVSPPASSRPGSWRNFGATFLLRYLLLRSNDVADDPNHRKDNDDDQQTTQIGHEKLACKNYVAIPICQLARLLPP